MEQTGAVRQADAKEFAPSYTETVRKLCQKQYVNTVWLQRSTLLTTTPYYLSKKQKSMRVKNRSFGLREIIGDFLEQFSLNGRKKMKC